MAHGYSAARVYCSINRPPSRKLGAYQQQQGDTVTDTSTYRPIQLSDFKDGQSIRPQVFWGGGIVCLAIQLILPAYFLNLESLAIELKDYPIIRRRVSDYLIIDPKAFDYYFVSVLITPIISLFLYFHIRSRYTPRFPKDDAERQVCRKAFFWYLVGTVGLYYLLLSASIITSEGTYYRLRSLVFPPVLPLIAVCTSASTAYFLLHLIPLKKNREG